MDHRTLSSLLRILAAVGALIAGAVSVWSLGTTVSATTAAPLGWRVQALLVDAWVPLLLTLGFALAATPRRTFRKLGWGLVFATTLVSLLWAWHVITHPPSTHGVSPVAMQTTLRTTLRVALAASATLARLDHATRTQRVESAYRQHSESLFTYALYLNDGAVPAAHDIVHELFLALLSGKRDSILQRDDNGLKAHLFEYVTRAAKDIDRGKRRRDQYETAAATVFADMAPSPDQDQDAVELRTCLAAALKRIPPRTAEAFHLVHEIGCSYADTARIMGITATTVRWHVKQACELLRPFLRDWNLSPSANTLQSEAV